MSEEVKTSTSPVVMVRVYLASSHERQQLLFRRLQKWEKLKGATMTEATAGFGEHGMAKGTEIPAVIEFFDTEEAATQVIADIRHLADHIVSWPATEHLRAE